MPHSRQTALTSLLLGSLVLAASTFSASGAFAASLEEQRTAFMDVYASAELGVWEPVEEQRALLEPYVLWPDLKAAYFRANLSDDKQVRAYLDDYGHLRPGREVRYRYARRIARRKQHADYLDIYSEHYSDAGDSVLDCLAANAQLSLGHTEAAMELGARLWQTGRSQAKECDPVFSAMRVEGRLTKALLQTRYDLAIAANEFLLARYVARSLGDDKLAEANSWLRARGNPAAFLENADTSRNQQTYQDQIGFAAKRLAIRSPEKAWQEWRRLGQAFSFSPNLERSVAGTVALWAVRRRIDGVDDLLASLPTGAIGDEVIHWQVRNDLRDGQWQQVIDGVNKLNTDRSQAEWRYWKAIALEQTGQAAESMLILSTLARERSYYGFLAADELGIAYAIETSDITADEESLERLAQNAELIRARELFLSGLDGRARSEWNAAVDQLERGDRIQAVLLAQRWQWPSRGIALAAKTGRYDSLDIRYPLPHREAFDASAKVAGIPVSWAYGVARSESIFMRDIRSSAGAIGLMQLMPATGRRTAKELRIPYRGTATLTDPGSNIRLGSSYLAKMQDRFGGHPAVATAAYNAGPSRVSRWLPDMNAIDARIWVETIPFKETRGYVQRVLTADIIFQWRLSGTPGRLSDRLPAILPSGLSRVSAD